MCNSVSVGTSRISVVSGMNAQKMAISEIGVTFPDSTFGKESRFGIPFSVIAYPMIHTMQG